MTIVLSALFSHAQSDTLLARPDFQNWLFDPRPEIPGVPTLSQAPAITLISGGVWASGDAGTPSDGQIELVQTLIGQPMAPGVFWYLAPAPLPVQSRFRDERLTVHSAVDSAGRYRNHYTPIAEVLDVEHAVYLKSTNVPGLTLHLVNGENGDVVKPGQPIPGKDTEVLLTFAIPTSREDTVRVGGANAGQPASYEIALYPVLRPGRSWSGVLAGGDRVLTNRSAAVGTGRWIYDDYLLQGVRAGERIAMRVDEAEFTPFIEVRTLTDDEVVQEYHEGANFAFTVGGTPELGPRDYLIRVTTAASSTLGRYRVTVSRIPEIWSFTPASGLPGTWVTVRGVNFLDSGNPLVTGVLFGGAPGASKEPVDLGTSQEIETQVPPEALSGPITLLTATEGVQARSTNSFVVFSPVGAVRREASGGISFGVSNAVAGIRQVVEATSDLRPPVEWARLATNVVDSPGVWRFTNEPPLSFPQRFYRIRREN